MEIKNKNVIDVKHIIGCHMIILFHFYETTESRGHLYWFKVQDGLHRKLLFEHFYILVFFFWFVWKERNRRYEELNHKI